jgi:hypothetical protein
MDLGLDLDMDMDMDPEMEMEMEIVSCHLRCFSGDASRWLAMKKGRLALD